MAEGLAPNTWMYSRKNRDPKENGTCVTIPETASIKKHSQSQKLQEEVPEDVSNTWIDELTTKQFNEELPKVFLPPTFTNL